MTTTGTDFEPDFASPAEWAALYRACRLQVVPGYIPGEPMSAPPGCRFFTVVRNIATGARMRFLVLNMEGAETDLPETTARAIWEAAATPYMREIEAQLRKAAGPAASDEEAA